MGKEFELKYQASPEILAQIQARLGDFTPITMETHYYDTPERDLGALRWTLRRRMENGVSICALKTPGTNDVRGEWETENADITQGVAALCRMDVPEEFRALAGKGLVEVCGARFTRLAKLVDYPGGSAEVALDQGVFLGGGKELPFSELEVELKSGSREAVEAYAAVLAQGLETQSVSKFERAMALAQGE